MGDNDNNTMLSIAKGALTDRRVVDLLRAHLANALAQTAPGSAHALDLSGLQSPDVQLWTIWDAETLLGIGALKQLSPDHGEVKSMYVDPSQRRRGVARALLRHIIETARAQGKRRLSLETGSWEYFRPARQLYASQGFIEGPPFGDYAPDSNSVFMFLVL